MPWVYVAFRLLMGNSIRSALGGAVLGHVYYFLVDALPLSYGYNIIKTPILFVDMVSFMSGRTQTSGVEAVGGEAPFARRPGVGGTTGYSWGQGRTLGSN